jgi:hypothetical protein
MRLRLAIVQAAAIVVVIVVVPLLFFCTGSFVYAQDAPTPVAPPLTIKDSAAMPSAPSAGPSLANEFIEALGAGTGRFVLGTKGGDPATSNDDNRRLLYGYPLYVGTSFSSVRIVGNGIVSDYRLGTDGDTNSLAPLATPVIQDSALRSEYVKDGVRIVERVYFGLNPDTERNDAAIIEYTLTNENSTPRQVGLRMMLDTMIGSNDGAPYFIQGSGRTTQQFEWIGNVPDYWIAYESTIFAADSLKGRGQLRGDNLTPPDRFVVADWPFAYGTTWDYVVDSADAVTNDSAVILYYNPIQLEAGASRTIRTSYGIARAGDVQSVAVTGIEVTQGIQNPKNEVDLIQDRPTVVRVHVRTNGGTVAGLTARLYGTRNGTALPSSPLTPDNSNGRITAKSAPARSVIDDSFYFRLPDSWLNGTVDLKVDLLGATFACRDVTGTGNDCKTSVSFAGAPRPEIRLVGVSWKEGSTSHAPDEDDYKEVERQIEAALPAPEINVDAPYTIEPVFLNGAPTNDALMMAQMIRLNGMLGIQRTLDGCGFGCSKYYLGVLVDRPRGPEIAGLASGTPGNVANGFVIGDALVLPHELGHLAGRSHVACGDNIWGTDSQYPYPGGLIGGSGGENDQFAGLDIGRKEIFAGSTGDLMGYCQPAWPSNYTYNAIRSEFARRFGGLQTSSALAVQSGQPAILVSGQVKLNQWGGSISSAYAIPAPAAAAIPAAGTYTLSLRNAAGIELESHAFTPDIPSEGNTGTFTLLLPMPEGTKQLLLMYAGQVLDSRIASPATPKVTVLTPNGGENLTGVAVASWQASDADGDALTFALQYSSDGGQYWQTLIADYSGTSYPLPINMLAGGTNSLLRVIVTDGFNSSSDVSDGPFTVAKHAPSAAILEPAAQSLFVAAQSVTLKGSGNDPEDGMLSSDANFSWASDRSGPLGSGRSLTLNAQDLVEGQHTVTLTVIDSDGTKATASVQIVVSRTPVTLLPGWQLSSSSLQFAGSIGEAAPAAQLLSIRNRGDGEFQWTATSDRPWLLLSSLAGASPSDILVGVNTSALTPGTYDGTITFASPQLGQHYSVNVRLDLANSVPARVEVTPSVLTLAADGASQAAMQARVLDPRGRPLINQPVVFSTSAGSIVPSATTDAQGMATATLTAGTVVAIAQVTVTAGAISESTSLLISAGPPAVMELESDVTAMSADGVSTAPIMLLLQDAFGHPLSYQEVAFSTTLGTITPVVVTDRNGQATAVLTAPHRGGTATITAIAGSAQARLQFTLVELPRVLLPYIRH